MIAELVSYTNHNAYVLMKIDDGAVPGKILFTIETLTPSDGRVTGIFLNFLYGRPRSISAASVSGASVNSVAFDTKDLGGGNNVNPSPSQERPKGLFDVGIALTGNGPVAFVIDNPGGSLDCYSFGPFAMRVVLGRGNGPAAKLFGVPELPTPNPVP